MHCQANHIFEDNTSQFTQTGNAHDIAMSPNGSRVVVNHRNWIHVFNARGTMLAAFNVGSSAPALQPTDPLLAVDSIAITDSRAVVVTNRQGVYTWVYVIDLLVNPPVIVRDEQIGGSVANQHSHDVAVSPNGNRAVVTANGALAIFDLQINQLVFEQEDSSLFREFATLKDSVEMSDTRAVVLSDSNESGVLAVEGPSL
jgi:DNA-binding beta-propeller fold protein YncE